MSSGRKPRYTLFSVGRNKASPARTASVKRASLRASVIRTDAPKLHLALQDAGEADPNGCKPPANSVPSLSTRDTSRAQGESSPEDMKDAPLPLLPDDPAASRKSSVHPPPESRPARPPPTSRMPPPAHQSGPLRPPHHSATMSQPRPPQRQVNFFRRLTSKIRLSSSNPAQPSRDAPQHKGTALRMPSMPKAPPPAPMPNDFTSAEQRQAALRARGLIPASSAAQRRFRDAEGFMMPLSEQEAEIDKRYTVVVARSLSEEDGEDVRTSEARKIREAWLAKQHAAAPEGGAAAASASAAPSADAATNASLDGIPLNSDAAARASKDGTVGQKSPMRATFVHAATLSPNVGEINIGGGSPPRPGSLLKTTVENFHTAPNSPMKADDVMDAQQSGSGSGDRPARVPTHSFAAVAAHTLTQEPSTPSSHSSAVTEKVSRWLRTSSDIPAPTADFSSSSSSPPHSHTSPLTESPKQSLDETPTPIATAAPTPTGTVRARKEKPPPIIVTSHRPAADSHPHPKAPQAAQVIALAISAPSDSEASTSSEGRPSRSLSCEPRSETRGRGLHVSTSMGPPRLAHDVSTSSNGTTTTGGSSRSGTATTSGRSRTNTVPALSPTRTVSSSGASSSLPTPTTTCARDASISRGSTSHSSDGGHGLGHETHVRARRGTTGEMNMSLAAAKARRAGAAGVIMEEYSETEPSSDGGEGEFGVRQLPPLQPPVLEGVAVPRLRPQSIGHTQLLESQAKANNRKSFSLFGKKSLDMQRDTRPSSSMLNLRRAFNPSKPRPNSTIGLSPVAEQGQGAGASQFGANATAGMGWKKSKGFDASHLPASPTFPPPRPSTSSMPSNGKTTGVGLRPRMAVAPTMHSRGSILHQAHFIEDEESRRLSEMAFLT